MESYVYIIIGLIVLGALAYLYLNGAGSQSSSDPKIQVSLNSVSLAGSV